MAVKGKKTSITIRCIKRLVQQQSGFSGGGGAVNSGAAGTGDTDSGSRFESMRSWIGVFIIVTSSKFVFVMSVTTSRFSMPHDTEIGSIAENLGSCPMIDG